jgi:hypothetical protein
MADRRPRAGRAICQPIGLDLKAVPTAGRDRRIPAQAPQIGRHGSPIGRAPLPMLASVLAVDTLRSRCANLSILDVNARAGLMKQRASAVAARGNAGVLATRIVSIAATAE